MTRAANFPVQSELRKLSFPIRQSQLPHWRLIIRHFTSKLNRLWTNQVFRNLLRSRHAPSKPCIRSRPRCFQHEISIVCCQSLLTHCMRGVALREWRLRCWIQEIPTDYSDELLSASTNRRSTCLLYTSDAADERS